MLAINGLHKKSIKPLITVLPNIGGCPPIRPCSLFCLIETMSHIYQCELYNEGKQQALPYEKIFCGNINEEIEVYRRFKQNLEKRVNMKQISYPCDFGPLYLSKG